MVKKMVLEIGDTEITLSLEQVKELYRDLKEIFDKNPQYFPWWGSYSSTPGVREVPFNSAGSWIGGSTTTPYIADSSDTSITSSNSIRVSLV